MKMLIFVCFTLIIIGGCFAQKPVIGHADCSSAIVLTDTIYGPTEAPDGFGKIQEFNADKKSMYFFEQEHNTVWYSFIVPTSGLMTMELIPEQSKDDYDFLIFRDTEGFCESVSSGNVLPVRSNISRNDQSIRSRTGLKGGNALEFVHSGPGKSFSKALEVWQGEKYFLVVDNVYPQGKGYTLILHFQQQQTTEKSKPTIAFSGDIPVVLSIRDATTRKLLEATTEVFVSDPATVDTVPAAEFQGSSVVISSSAGEILRFRVSKPGYAVKTEKLLVRASDDTVRLKVYLPEMKKGEKVQVENLYFVGNQAVILPVSIPALNDLVLSLKSNPGVSIIIHGHVNGPNQPNTIEYQVLSDNRAKAVLNFLVEHGIDNSRLSWQGHGNTEMIYPNPFSERESGMNRRVEVEVK
ncbi:MAG: OmpA family protein [Bacteroidetes bacterium]|nr:OmpA family protein [Bacteroidota bacterium]MBU1718289.1 OmpA family protein [Bacteroidota bacterium]